MSIDYTTFITSSGLDNSDTEARTQLTALWNAYIAQAVGLVVKTARKRDFEKALVAAGYAVGTVQNIKFVGGLQIPGTPPRPKRHWVLTKEGFMRLSQPEATGSAVARERGLAEAAGV
jgi:hypothetical protein